MPLELEEWTRDILVGCGLTEIISYSMTNLESVARLNPEGAMPDGDDYIRLANPLSREHEYMRKTLLNTTLETVARNRRFVDHVAIFEIACVYLPREDRALPDEPRRLSIALMGPREQRSWLTNESAEMDFYDLKGVVETLCEHLGITDVSYAPADHPTFHPGRTAELIVGGEPIGVFGEVHPRVRENFDLPDERVCLLELDLEALLDAAQPVRHYEPISRMPALKLDLAVVVDKSVPSDAVGETIRNTGGALLVDVVLFDVYRGEQLGVGKKSLAYSLTFQAPDKTLTTEEAMKQRERIIKQLQQQYDAGVRA
jgi:phenylalanyl-tRNA synthetase beta chain